ncbi:MAG TPA: methyltransferase domain-containing protein [Nitrospiraceae bacterium]|nr:methyltransferase domain-containing protein [Nitrospiraceae bacterium]
MAHDAITQAVSERYARAALTGEQMCCPTGYNMDDLKRFIPEEVLNISYGCGTPAGLDTVGLGETVLDIGSGGGIDCFEAARRVGPAGRVIGVDMTDAMLDIARRNAPVVARNLGYADLNVEFRKGHAVAMPVADNSIDLIISNCVINLAPDKQAVFREMFRILKPGGRFTISDIVADQPVPNYLMQDTVKWGNCLSGALPVSAYMAGMIEAGFLGLHQIKHIPWQVIDGIHFLSLTFTGYKLPMEPTSNDVQFATLRGPFRCVIDERGHAYERGRPEPIDCGTARLLQAPPFHDLFLLTDSSAPLTASDPRWCSIQPPPVPCVWKGDYALFTGPFLEVEDDDHHVYRRGTPVEICSKTLAVLESSSYRRHFAVINRASASEQTFAEETSCNSTGSCC